MFNDVINLVKQTKTVNEYGDHVVAETVRTVFAEVKSVGYGEFYQANAAGFKPEIKFVLADFLEYEDEPVVRYTRFTGSTETADEYRVIRTYRSGNLLELVCQRGVDR